MLRFLSIKRLAVIDAVELEFGPGLNVLTGETGAGKSILVEAVGLLLGGRASGDLVRTGAESATIEAIFESGGEELLVRREVTAQGRSRAFVNGDLATAGALKDLSGRLIELHGQHEHHTLLDPSTHLATLDAFGELDSLLRPVAAEFDVIRTLAEELVRVRQTAANRDARHELLTFQLAELDRAQLTDREDERLSETRHVLASAERLERLCAESYAALYESDDAVLAHLGGIWRRVTELAALDRQFLPYLEARDGIKSQLEDLALFLRRYADGIDASPAHLQKVEERLALLERLKRKYGPALSDVIAHRDRLRRELDDLDRSDERQLELEHRYDGTCARYLDAARQLSEARHAQAPDFARQLERLLGELAMERTQFEARFSAEPLPESAWTAAGVDVVEFFISPNPGEDLRPLARIASGGELSRIMLAIKTLTATRRHELSEADDRRAGGAPPGLVFDEIDAGIGGRAADVVGRKLRALGSAFQVLCITHLPQIAAYADRHFLIEKQVDGGRTQTRVARLDDAGRVEELARMLGGDPVTEALRTTAREMLLGRQVYPTHPAEPEPPEISAPAAASRGESTSKGESERAKGETAKRRTGRGLKERNAAKSPS
jgi:DNA repair protein RecN (Recombination protein N)